MRNAYRIHTVGCAIAAFAYAMPSVAQDNVRVAATNAENEAVAAGNPQAQSPVATNSDEIIVTARRRDERLQDVPLAVSVVSREVIRDQQITNASDLARVAPNLTATPGQGGSRSLPVFAIRGLSQQELTGLADPSVPVYIGDVIAARAQGLNGALFDIGSVEVLRGPQGTLFGRNATGGAVIIRPATPEDNFSAMASVTYGNFDRFNVEGMINVPVSENFIVRVAGTRQRDDGYIRDVLLDRNINNTSQEGARVSALIRGNGGFKSLTTYDYFHENGGGTGTYIKFANPDSSLNAPGTRAALGFDPIQGLLDAQQDRGIYDIANGVQPYSKVETHTIQNRTEVDLSDEIVFRNILGYRQIEDHLYEDFDGTSNAIHVTERVDDFKQMSWEAQLLGDTDHLDWIVGGFYFYEKGRNQGISAIGSVDPGQVEDTDSAFDYVANVSNTDTSAINESYAVFAQGTYDFSGIGNGLSITAGVRYNWDDREALIRNRTEAGCRFTKDTDGNPATPEVAVPLSQCFLKLSESFSELTYNASLEYRFDRDHMIYAAHRHGYRTGGFGARASTEQGLRQTFNPETVDDIEVGFKADWRPGNMFLRTNVAGYYAKYNDIQRLLQNVQLLQPTTTTANAGKARIWGVEVETLFRPIPELELSANYAYTNAKFTEFANPFDGTDLSDQPFARAPKNTFTIGARYTLPLDPSLGDIAFGANYYHQDKYNGSDSFDPPNTIVEKRDLVSANISWNRIAGSQFDVAAFVNNLFQEKYSDLYVSIPSLGYTSFTPGQPRTYGLTVRAHFGAN